MGFKSGGGSAHGPAESHDSARSMSCARVLDILSEGEIEGLSNGLQSVYLNGTPLQNADGSINFPGTTLDFRAGSQDQDYIPGFPAVESETGVSVELRADVPYARAVTNPELSALRVRLATPQFQQVNPKTGDVTGCRVEYVIELATDGGAYQVALSAAFDFKVSGKYERSHRVNLPPAEHGWMLRIRRLTQNASSSTVSDRMAVESITEIIDAKLRYPNTALAGVQVDASQFQGVPTRSYRVRGRRIRVPSNYDPQRRAYAGVWDGTFRIAWTDNPAWIYYDLALHPRYGMGHRIRADQLNRYALYQIGQYCDELVPDGKGGMEPRFTCNVYLQRRADASRVLQDLASVFRGVSYWASGNIEAVADMPVDPVYTYTAGNVIGGKFVLRGTDRKVRYTSALVSWSDPANRFRQAVECVEDRDGKMRYGLRQTELTAFGCTSQGQAQRVGKWLLLTARMETQEVSFGVGLEGAIALPGQVIRIADPDLAGRPIGGRVAAVSARTVTVDRDPVARAGDWLIVNLPTGSSEVRSIAAVDGRNITVAMDWTTAPRAEAVWAIESDDLAIPAYRVVSVTEKPGDESFAFEITAVQHEPGKFDHVDFGTKIEPRPVTVIPPSVQPVPGNVVLSTFSRIDQGIAVTVMNISWTAAPCAVQYEVSWRKDNGEWVLAGKTGSVNIEVSGIYAGQYIARVTAINAMNVPSLPAFSALTALQGKTTPPPAVTWLRTHSLVFGIEVEWGLPEDAPDTQRTELWYSRTPQREVATKLGEFAYPQHRYSLLDLRAGASLFFWARLVDRSGNVGPWYPDGVGVNGQSSSDATPVLEFIKGQITKTELGQDLLGPIEAIPDIRMAVAGVGSRVDGIEASLSPSMAGDEGEYAGSNEVYVGVWSEQSTRAEADLALARRVDVTTASMASAAAKLDATIQTETRARVEADRAQASQITSIQAVVNENRAAVQTVAQSYADLNGRVSASYQIKTQVSASGRTYIAGVGVGVNNDSGVVESQVLVSASRFAVIDPNSGAVTAPFVIQNGQTFINQAFIGHGWIQNAMIGDVIESATTGTNGLPRWRLDKNGGFLLNGAGSGDGYITLDSSLMQVFSGSGARRMRIGIWRKGS
ncbi:host specificity protein J [Paraburkholderia bonniea]|uniref:host specificity protein J n=2 Tax=Paraburkholderia bonniea TaxID=2152891 RepID=UPI0025731170|nr:host specificity protein J [Paraburkholderia bonniea]WJF92010.1 host specificity protein J [Paraburkholderia bonniea]WJF95329.1 host specificity protein J [Paraburkholderia bonniea]